MLSLLLALTALGADAISMSAVRHVQAGDAVPSVTFTPGVHGSMQVALSCGGRRFSLSGAISPGKDRVLTLDGLGTGAHSCSGTLSLQADDGSTGEMPLSIQVAVHPPLELSVASNELDLDGHKLWLDSSRPLRSARIEVIGERGAVLGDDTIQLDGATRTELAWTQLDGEVLQLRITGEDANTLRGERVLSPWSYAIPHEDVVFGSGDHAITKAEEPKLEAAWKELQSVRERYGDVVEVQLFVAGYTDTVGASASNQGLSERRARAIAAWFRSRGFQETIWFQGFGEDALAVATPDGTNEAANRRAIYLVAAQKPAISTELPRSNWRRL